jgi:hypothetical protein
MEQHIVDWKQMNDQRHIFLSCYRMMTANMFQSIESDAFHDKEWVNKLLHHFSDYYFEALACYDCGEEVPLVWQQVHQFTKEKNLHEIQQLIIGVNAHINYDLVLTLYDMLLPEWTGLSAEEQKNRYDDYTLVNEIIANTIDKVQDEILEPSDPIMGWIDRALGRLDEYLLSRLINSWRQDVWENAQKMLELTTATQRETFRQRVERNVMQRGKLLSV